MERFRVRRYHSLDALRAAMMLLGLVLHSAASYTRTPLRAVWPYHDAHNSVVFDLLLFFIHIFRMPTFFVVAGFFAALLYHRDGAPGFARNRAMRVALPLVLFWGVMTPALLAGFMFSARRAGLPLPWDVVPEQSLLRQPILGHLWFLYYLLLFYAAALAVVPLAARGPGSLRTRAAAVFHAIAATRWGAVMMAGVTAATLLPMSEPGIDTHAALLVPAKVLVAYGVFFGFGWVLFGHQDVLTTYRTRWKGFLAGGALASVAYLFVVGTRLIPDAAARHAGGVALAGLSIWLSIFGIAGLFLRYMEKPRPVVRYLSDASYWMYLTHLVATAWLPGVLARADAHAFVKFTFVFGLTTLITLMTYHYFVRSTVIGALLNGRRYPRALPQAAPREAEV